MPTTYTHWRFGNEVINNLPVKYQEIVNKYRHEFDYGVHGPDMFYYYNIFKSNELVKFGYSIHDVVAKKHFEIFKKNLKDHPNKEAGIAYILGYLSHFTLDSYCHTYVNLKEAQGKVSHARIEAQFDRYLLIKDGKDPVKSSLTFSLIPSKEVGDNIYYVYKKFNIKDFERLVYEMKTMLNILKDTSDFKRNVLSKVMDLAGFSKYKDLFTDKYNDPECADSNLRLEKYYNLAKDHYKELALELIDYLELDKPLGSYFDNDFDYKEYLKDEPVLSLEEEKNYVVYKQH